MGQPARKPERAAEEGTRPARTSIRSALCRAQVTVLQDRMMTEARGGRTGLSATNLKSFALLTSLQVQGHFQSPPCPTQSGGRGLAVTHAAASLDPEEEPLSPVTHGLGIMSPTLRTTD